MAQKVQVLFIDDLDGSEAEGTVSFGLDGAHYEIDLNQVHARELRTILARYAGAGRKITGPGRRPARRRGSAATEERDTTEIRDWAKANGFEVKDRGRIPAEVVARFQAATGR
jgi:hypothetical protein